MPKQKKTPASKTRSDKQVRGSDLRSKMIASDEYGSEYRSAHQGHDELTPANTRKMRK